jgi:2-methylisocitrate lyase-like PEP mutase family enzyme
MPIDTSTKRDIFRALHEKGCFVIPNPWDTGSARRLANLGFKALASTSSGYAWTMGRQDGELSRDEVLAHLRILCAPKPVNVLLSGPDLRVADLAEVGVRRVSVGGALAAAAWTGFDAAAKMLVEEGRVTRRILQ